MFYGKFADERNSSADNLNTYNVEGDNMLSPGRGLQRALPGKQPRAARSVLIIRFLFAILFSKTILFTKHLSFKHFGVVSV
jgi:hypothetical protein